MPITKNNSDINAIPGVAIDSLVSYHLLCSRMDEYERGEAAPPCFRHSALARQSPLNTPRAVPEATGFWCKPRWFALQEAKPLMFDSRLDRRKRFFLNRHGDTPNHSLPFFSPKKGVLITTLRRYVWSTCERRESTPPSRPWRDSGRSPAVSLEVSAP